MNLGSLRRNKVWVAVGVLVVLAVVGGAYLAFADDEPVEISNAEELQQIRENPSGNYVLVDDIDMSHIDNFEPIENFTGTLDGNGHTISNLTINRPEMDWVGLFLSVRDDTRLFGLVGDKGTVKDVRLKDANVTGDKYVGSLAGANLGTVTGSSTTGEVRGDEVVGGLVGQNEGTIRESYTSNYVSGDSVLGGLVGWNYGGIVESYSTSDVTGGSTVGGLVGTNHAIPRTEGTVVKSYSTGDVSGEEEVGGLVGHNRVDGDVSESYATGRVMGDNKVGGLVGVSSGDVSNSYWDTGANQRNNSVAGTGLTTDEMTGSAARENMDGFDFGETWRTTEDDYPRLAWQDEGSESDE